MLRSLAHVVEATCLGNVRLPTLRRLSRKSGSAIQFSGRTVAGGATGTGMLAAGKVGAAVLQEAGGVCKLATGPTCVGCGGSPPGEGYGLGNTARAKQA